MPQQSQSLPPLLSFPKLCGSLWTNHFQWDASWHRWGGEKEICAFAVPLSGSPSHPSSTPGMVESVRPISHTLSTVTFLHEHALSPLPLFTVYPCCLPSELPPTLSFTLNIQHSLPPLPPSLIPPLASSTSYIPL